MVAAAAGSRTPRRELCPLYKLKMYSDFFLHTGNFFFGDDDLADYGSD